MTDRELLDKLFCSALAAVDPFLALPPHLLQIREIYRACGYQRLVVAGFGKAALPMALAAEEALEDSISAGLVIVPHHTRGTELPSRIRIATAGHPHPDQDGVSATKEIMALAGNADEKTLLLLLISGGGSALLTAPTDDISLEQKLVTSRLLMEAGADIGELNTVRKHLSKVKGGRLAALAHPSRLVTIAISDVPGDRPDLIASGPAYPDPTTFGDAVDIIERLGVAAKIPTPVRNRLLRGATGALAETPKPGDPLFSAVTTIIAANNRLAREAAAKAARQQGLRVHLLEDQVCGEAREAGKRLAEIALKQKRNLARGERLCLISGGETTVKVVGRGKGGRNQELAVAFALAVAGEAGITLLSAGTDGIDGPTDAAGGIVDGTTAARAKAAGLDPIRHLEENDAYPLLQASAGLLKTGATGTNVMDLQIAIVTG